jgi:hypothetical protein
MMGCIGGVSTRLNPAGGTLPAASPVNAADTHPLQNGQQKNSAGLACGRHPTQLGFIRNNRKEVIQCLIV